MSDENSIPSASADKPSKPPKPYPEFPLTPHMGGRQWCKRIKGRLFYFGPLSDPDAALARYLREKEDLQAGRTPRPDPEAQEGVTFKTLCNNFLNEKRAKVNSGELTERSWQDYKTTCDLLVSHFGKSRRVEDVGPSDFASLRNKLARKWALTTLGNFIQRARVLFKFALDNDLLDKPARYGQGFARPSKKVLRKVRNAKGPKLFQAADIRRMLDTAGIPLRAMILLGINCGFGNADCGTLPLTAVDMEEGLIDYPRPKTGIPRRCPLWPETVAALREVLAAKPTPRNPEDAPLVFITRWGLPWNKTIADSPITKEFKKLLQVLDIQGNPGLGFYGLRHTFRTVAVEAKDQPAIDHIMGHEISHMSSVYREKISDERLQAVTDHVRAWLFGEPKQSGQGEEVE